MFSDDIGHLLKNDDHDFRLKRCVYIWTWNKVKYWGSRTTICRFILSPPIFYLKRERKNLIIKWSSLFSLKTERQWWNSNWIFAFTLFYYDIFRKKRKLLSISLLQFLPKADWQWRKKKRCVSFSFSRVYFVFIERLVTIWWWPYRLILYSINRVRIVDWIMKTLVLLM
jgi:hypothetical protein